MSRLQKILDHTYFLFLPYMGNGIIEFLIYDHLYSRSVNMQFAGDLL